MPSDAITPAVFADAIHVAWSRYVERGRREPSPHKYVYASAYRKCERRMVFEMRSPELQPPFSPNAIARMNRGGDRARDLLIDVMRVGRECDPPFNVVAQEERFVLRGRDGLPAIVGKVDARLNIIGTSVSAPLEVKAWAATTVDRIDSFEDVLRGTWTASGGYQTLAYLYGSGEPFGFMLLDRAGLPLLLPVELDAHLDEMEAFLSRAERAVAHERAGTLPDFLVGDAAECQRCAFYGSVCNPPLVHEGATVLNDPELEALLEQREALRDAGQAFDRIDKDVKARLRGIEHGVAGPFIINGSWGKQSRLELPADLRKQHTIVDPRGRFTLDITKVA